MVTQSSYLNQLKFDPKLEKSWIAAYLANPRLVFLLVFLTVVVGVVSFLNLPRVLNPEIKIPIVIVSTVIPGANPSDVESLVTVPIEESLASVPDVTTITSSSRDSVSVISLEFETGVDPDKARTDVQSAVDSVTTLPTDAQAPKVNKLDFQNQPIWVFQVTGNGDTASLMRFAQLLKDKVKELPTVDTVDISGLEEEEIQVVIKPESIATYKLNPLAVSQSVKAALGSYPAGSVSTDTSTFTLSINQQVTNIDDIRKVRIAINNTVFSLGEIAEVSQRSKPDQYQSFYADSKTSAQRSVTFYVYKAGTTSIDKAFFDSETVVNETVAQYHNTFSVYNVINFSHEIDDMFHELSRDFWLTVSLIFISLFIFLGTRQAVVASLATPLSFLVTFTVMNIAGIAISFIALFSLLLALGLLIDDTIVVISAMTAYYRTGKFTPLQTGLLVWKDFLVPILTTTITTVWAFIPLLLSSGIIGEFIKPIPIVVSSALLASLFIAMLVTLPFIIIILKPSVPKRVLILLRIALFVTVFGIFLAITPRNSIFPLALGALILFWFVAIKARYELVKQARTSGTGSNRVLERITRILDEGIINFETISRFYKRIISRILSSSSARRKVVAMVIIFSLFSYLLLPLGFVKNEFFPKSDNNYIYVNLELPAGTNLEITRNEALQLLERMRTIDGAEYITADLGRNYSAMGGGNGGKNSALFTFVLKPHHDRNISSLDIAQQIRSTYGGYQKGTLSVVEVSGGPPAGADIQIKLFGDDLTELINYADTIQSYLKSQAGVTNVDKTIKPGTSKIAFVPDNQKVAQAGLSVDSIGLWLRTFASGYTVDSLKIDNQDTDIVIRTNSYQQQPEDIQTLIIPTPKGDVSLATLGELRLETNPTLITREDGKRTISVTASVTPGYSVTTINQQLEKFVDTQLNLPAGYSWATGGMNEENQKSVNSILQAMGLSFVLILLTMVIQFASFRRALIVLLVIPLSIAGVFIIFALLQIPLSFPALVGVLALFGIVVKNSILIVDKIVQNRNAGIDFKESIVDGSAGRLEAIALTSLTAILGLIPITLSNALWRGLGGAIIAGLTFSGTIMLFFIPLVYYYWFRSQEEK